MNTNSLLQKAGTGDQDAFQAFYQAVSPKVLGLLMRMLGDRFVAEDVLQEAMVQAWNRSADFDPTVATGTTWVTTIARHKAIDQLRKTGRYSRMLHEDENNISTVFSLDQLQDQGSESSLTQERLANCFGKLNSDASSCILLAYIDGFTFSEIAGKVGRSLGTVKSWIRRGMTRLQECMAQ